MMKKFCRAAGLALILTSGVAGAALAQAQTGAAPAMEGMDHGQTTNETPSAGTEDRAATEVSQSASPVTEAYRAANMAMHSAMDLEFSGDADIDFARGMIGHHQGAIDMARILLEHGEDPELRQLAEAVIEAQEAEIAFLREWLAKNEN